MNKLLIPWRLALGTLFTLAAVGCTLNSKGDQEVSDLIARQERDRSDQSTRYAGVAPRRLPTTRTAATRPTATPEHPTALREYILLALAENPELKAARQNAFAKAKRIPQVTALPDPMIATRTYSPNRPMSLADGNNVFVMSLRQQLPHPEKLDRAGRVALEETRMALADLEQIRLRVIADVKRAYFQLYIVGKSLEITRGNQALLREMIDVVAGQVAAGKRTQDEALRAQVEFADLERDLIDLRQQQATAAATLNTLVNRRPDSPVPMPEDFDVRTADKKLDALLAQAGQANPELKKLQYQIERDRQSRRLAQLGYWPEFTIGLEWMAMNPRPDIEARKARSGQPAMAIQEDGSMMPMIMMPMGMTQKPMSEEGKDMYAIMVEMNLPIWLQKTDAAIKEAEYNLGASLDQYNAAKNMVAFRIQDALSRVRTQRELVILLRDTMIPQAQRAYELSRTSYTTGTSDFTGFITNWQNWLKFTIQYHRALGELERSIADLEQEIGVPLAS